MGKFDEEILAAKEMIKEDGDNNVLWHVTGKSNISTVQPGTSEYLQGEDKPWLKRSIQASDNEEDNVKPYTVDILFLPLSSSGSIFKSIGYEQRSDIPTGSIMGLMASQEFTPKLKDQITKNGEKLDLVMCDPIAPDSVDIMYVMAFK